MTLDSVQGPVKFDNLGENTAQKTLTFQWQNGTLVAGRSPTGRPAGSQRRRQYPKPNWKG